MATTTLAPWRLYFVPEMVLTHEDELLRRTFDTLDPTVGIADLPPEPVGRSFFVNDEGELHTALNLFFASGRMRNRSEGTNRKYAHSLRVWMDFLARKGKEWDAAVDEDVLDYKFWRRTDERNPRPVSGSTWAGDVAALTIFYDWARRALQGPALLLDAYGQERSSRHPNRQQGGLVFQPSTVRGADVKWLSPGAFRLWRNVGIHGMTPDGVERVRWRPRSQSRDAAFVDGLYGSGLRIQEWASILTMEIRQPTAGRRYTTHDLADACAKGGRGHPYWLERSALDAVAGYMEDERAAAIRRAHDSGLYDRIRDIRIVERVSSDGKVEITSRDSSFRRTISLNGLNPNQRARLFAHSADGLAPVALWLNEDGAPRPKRAWYKAFERANSRVERAGIERLVCHPHMLRHSFALRWYAVGRLIWERRTQGFEDSYTRDFREQFGDSWSLVQTMLGHSDVNTTRRVYLEPFRALDLTLLLEYGRSELDAELLLQVLKADPRVRLADQPDTGDIQ